MINLFLGADGNMHARIPSALENREQVVSIPVTLDGLRILKRILVASDRGTAKLGHEAEPTQALVNEWLKAERQRQLATEVKGLEDLELEIEI